MKHFFLCSIFVSAAIQISVAQTAPKPAIPNKVASTSTSAAAPGIKLPPGVPRARGVVKVAFALHYQDVKIGTGADAEPNKLYKVLYTGWLAADGHKFDSSEDHRLPLKDKDGKPMMGDDGKPKLGDVQPISFPQGFGRVIPGFDQGFTGMKVGGKRRLFIPWQLAYGARGRPGPDPAHPGIPPKADLIFDIELVDVSEMQMPANHPGMMPVRPGMTIPPGHLPLNAPPSGSSGAAAKPGQTATPPAPEAPAGTPATATPPPATKPATPAPTTPPTTQPQSQPQTK
ncbi:MAG TPA: FKBP-type peptidyl-prolyl cis-trans isomerase [Terracidiphilus sp.]|nr:FKBP-type peptidyl-prolyl cis-trans isomerase [Terracidiphilus sp.]